MELIASRCRRRWFSWKILREDRIDQLIHLIDEGIDTGPIIDNYTSLFPKHCKIPVDFENYSLEKFNNFYNRFIIKVLNGKKFKLKPQIDYLGRYNPRLNTEIDGLLIGRWTPMTYIILLTLLMNHTRVPQLI